MWKISVLALLLLNFYTKINSSTNNDIIQRLKQTKNLSFNFKQTINNKIEKGYCVIKYPKKINCKYDQINQKILVSDGKSLVIVNNNSQYYFYPLKKTPLNLILDKNFIIEKINTLDVRKISNKYLNYTFTENNNIINIFFNVNTLDLVGWQTEDIYQNLVITFISSLKINQEINNDIFILPKPE